MNIRDLIDELEQLAHDLGDETDVHIMFKMSHYRYIEYDIQIDTNDEEVHLIAEARKKYSYERR